MISNLRRINYIVRSSTSKRSFEGTESPKFMKMNGILCPEKLLPYDWNFGRPVSQSECHSMEGQNWKNQPGSIYWQNLAPVYSKRATDAQWSTDHCNKRHHRLKKGHDRLCIRVKDESKRNWNKNNLQPWLITKHQWLYQIISTETHEKNTRKSP